MAEGETALEGQGGSGAAALENSRAGVLQQPAETFLQEVDGLLEELTAQGTTAPSETPSEEEIRQAKQILEEGAAYPASIEEIMGQDDEAKGLFDRLDRLDTIDRGSLSENFQTQIEEATRGLSVLLGKKRLEAKAEVKEDIIKQAKEFTGLAELTDEQILHIAGQGLLFDHRFRGGRRVRTTIGAVEGFLKKADKAVLKVGQLDSLRGQFNSGLEYLARNVHIVEKDPAVRQALVEKAYQEVERIVDLNNRLTGLAFDPKRPMDAKRARFIAEAKVEIGRWVSENLPRMVGQTAETDKAIVSYKRQIKEGISAIQPIVLEAIRVKLGLPSAEEYNQTVYAAEAKVEVGEEDQEYLAKIIRQASTPQEKLSFAEALQMAEIVDIYGLRGPEYGEHRVSEAAVKAYRSTVERAFGAAKSFAEADKLVDAFFSTGMVSKGEDGKLRIGANSAWYVGGKPLVDEQLLKRAFEIRDRREKEFIKRNKRKDGKVEIYSLRKNERTIALVAVRTGKNEGGKTTYTIVEVDGSGEKAESLVKGSSYLRTNLPRALQSAFEVGHVRGSPKKDRKNRRRNAKEKGAAPEESRVEWKDFSPEGKEAITNPQEYADYVRDQLAGEVGEEELSEGRYNVKIISKRGNQELPEGDPKASVVLVIEFIGDRENIVVDGEERKFSLPAYPGLRFRRVELVRKKPDGKGIQRTGLGAGMTGISGGRITAKRLLEGNKEKIEIADLTKEEAIVLGLRRHWEHFSSKKDESS